MNCFLSIVFVLFCAVFAAEEKYSTKYDSVDIDEILKSDRLVKNYVDCFLDKGTCTSEGEDFKANIIDALQTGCSKCSEKQKGNVRKVAHYLSGKKEQWWEELKAKYDPKGEFKEKYQKFIQEEGLDL